jgi:hypothetical protein
VSEDARNSIYLWIGGIAFAVLAWVVMRFDPFPDILSEWMLGVSLVVGIVSIVNLVRDLWTRRSRDGEL